MNSRGRLNARDRLGTVVLNRQWWSGRTGLERFDLVTRWQLYLLSASEPFVALLLIEAQPQRPGWLGAALLVLATAQAGACVPLLRASVNRALGGPRPATRLIGLAAGLTAAGLLVAVLAIPDIGRPTPSGLPAAFLIAVLFCGALTAAITPLLSVRRLAGVLVIPAAVAGVLGRQSALTFDYLIWVGMAVLTYRISVWYLGVVWEVDRSRQVQARLAVAEERLRFARDLHDVLGRNLTLIALDSELAVQLARRGQDGAIEHMVKVRQTVQDSMREMREVVGGYRAVDLESELAGARSLLRSAGIDARVIGDPAGLNSDTQAALGWVVREATTNIIRHSDASFVKLDLEVVPDAAQGSVAVLRIENDGVPGPAAGPGPGPGSVPDTHGAGLAGLRERLARLGGEVTAGAEPGQRFLVQARLPLTARVPLPAGPAEPMP